MTTELLATEREAVIACLDACLIVTRQTIKTIRAGNLPDSGDLKQTKSLMTRLRAVLIKAEEAGGN